MAHPGWLAIGRDDVLDFPYPRSKEVVNTNRALAYARQFGLTWLTGCDECEIIEVVVDGVTAQGGPYNGIAVDPAPWWHGGRPPSLDFLGVIGLELAGADDATHTAKVSTALRGGGVISLTYEQPRTMTLRAIAIAASEAGLSYGLRWLSEEFIRVGSDPCSGDPLKFFEVCPQVVCDPDTDRPIGPCWPTTYAELRDGPACAHDWWPTTYGQMRTGPPYLRTGDEGDWCDWAGTYRELRAWFLMSPWTCCHETEVLPHMHQFDDARVTEGPIVLQRPTMSVGAMAEIEFTIVAATPRAEMPEFYWTDTWIDWG